MAIRKDNSQAINLPSIEKFSNKADIREFLLKQWMLERPQTKYRYFVETFDDGLRIYLERPGRLNKGCDFVIYTENVFQWNNGNDRPPNHDFVLDDLKKKKRHMSNNQWKIFLLSIDKIFECNPFATTLKDTKELPIIGHSYELSLKLIRWFFIEQDITYWSGKGREMFYNAIHDL